MKKASLLFICLFLIPLATYSQDQESQNGKETVYELIADGSLEELREECKRRGLSAEGDEIALKRRLLHHESGIRTKPFEIRSQNAQEGDLILLHADVIDRGIDESDDELVSLSGDVQLLYMGKRIRADEIRINLDERLITGNGDVIFEDGDTTYIAEKFFYNGETDEGIFFVGKTALRKFIYRGKEIRKIDETDKYVAHDVSLSTCNLRDPHYRIEADTLYYYDSRALLIKKARFIYGQDELFRLPYFYWRLQRPIIRSTLFFRERSGLVVQNTYTPLQTDEKQLVLKGDLYERLGQYVGIDYSSTYETGETAINGSLALSNDVYSEEDFGKEVTEDWTPLGPPDASEYSIDRSLRYSIGAYQRFEFGEGYENSTEVNFYWVKDPYYRYDFERRKERFDISKLFGQPEEDSPRKGKGFSWYLNNYTGYNVLSVSLSNSLSFEPQRNTSVVYPSLSDYYEYRVNKLVAPSLTVSHGLTLFEREDGGFFDNLDYSSGGNYSHTVYYDEEGDYSSQVHRESVDLSFAKAYSLTRLLSITPEVGIGASGQQHVEPDSTELLDDRKNSLMYGRTEEKILFGSPNVGIELSHALKYKLLGPLDYYEFGRFREHNLGFRGFAEFGRIEEELKTSYELRPTYDWARERYEPFVFDKSHFDPLINTLSYNPFTGLTLKDIFVYDLQDSRAKTNSFILSYGRDDIYLRDRQFSVQWDLEWEHSFINPLLDTLYSKFGVTAHVHRFLTLYFSVLSRNDSVWRYIPKVSKEQGLDPINPLEDLLKSFNFFNRDDRESSLFKMKSISFGFIRDLHDWELKFDYTGNRELSYDESSYLWNNTYSVSIGLKEVEEVNISSKIREKR